MASRPIISSVWVLLSLRTTYCEGPGEIPLAHAPDDELAKHCDVVRLSTLAILLLAEGEQAFKRVDGGLVDEGLVVLVHHRLEAFVSSGGG